MKSIVLKVKRKDISLLCLFVVLIIILYKVFKVYKVFIFTASVEPTIFIITPTYYRPTQVPDLVRMSQTLMHIKNILWIVVEDSDQESEQVLQILNRSKVPFVYLLGPRPEKYEKIGKYGSGVSNRLRALNWLRDKHKDKSDAEGVLYFADDDNTYDIRLFDEIRSTKKFSLFPVGCIPSLGISCPILDNKTAKVIGFHDPWIGNRKFAVDMAGFAVSLDLFLSKPNASMVYKRSYIEDKFLQSLDLKLIDAEPKAMNCTEVLVWHTRTKETQCRK